VRILQGAIPPSGSANLRITDGTGTTTLRIVGTTDIPGLPTPTGSFTLIGVVAQFDSFRPFTRGYQILPRRRADLLLPLPASHGFSREPLIPRVVLPRGYLRETPAP
jgi:hypothetical protein